METVDYQSNLDARLAFKRLTGINIRLTPYESLVKIGQPNDETIVVQLVVHQADERKTETILKAQGTRLIQFTKTPSGWAQHGKPVTVWDNDFKPIALPYFTRDRSLAAFLQSREFTRMCGRPGTDRNPLDSHDRTAQGYSTRRMSRHWQ